MESVILSRENRDEGEEIRRRNLNVQYADHANSSTVQHKIAELNSRVQRMKPKHANRAGFSRVQHMKQIEKGGRSIFKVPLSIKKLESDAFEPHIVSIGPYHWHKTHLMEMETCKTILLDHVLKRAGMQLATLREKMSELEAATRKHYDQPFENIEDFVKMMMRDACFVLELFCIEAYGWENYRHTSDPYIRLNMKGFMPFVRRDLLMLENQLPLSVLQKMFTVLDWKKRTPNESIRSLAIKFFAQLIPGISENQPKHVKNRPPPPPAEEENRPPPPHGHLKNRKPAAAEENRSRPPPAAEENRLPPPRAAAAENRPPPSPPPHPENRLPPPAPQHENRSPPHPEDRPSPPPPPPPPPLCLHLLDIVHESLKPPPSANNKHWICTHGNCLISSPISLPCFSVTICVQDSDLERVSSDDIGMHHSVTSLRSTGIGFKENKNCEKFTDIQFDHKNGMLLIPRLHINGSTKSIFLNLMVFEQGYPFCSRLYITSYTIFMDGLVDSAKDAQHLIEKQIIYHELGSEDNVATLFNSLCREIYFKCLPDDCYLYDVSQKLNEHYQQKWRSWIATLKHEYLKDPWKTISLVAAALLILLTMAQTAYTVLSMCLSSLSHSPMVITALKPFFNAAASQFILGHQIPLPLWLSLAPIVFGYKTPETKESNSVLYALYMWDCCTTIRDELFETFRKRHKVVIDHEEVHLNAKSLHRAIILWH